MYQFPEQIQQLHNVYSDEIPDFMLPFITAPEMQRLGGIGQACGIWFTKMHNYKFFLTRLDHSVGVALIVRHFTQDKKQALAGLFHDISHTAFSHVGDFLRGDYENQDSSEVYHDDILKNSEVIMTELEALGLTVDDVKDYTRYPVADNNGPQLAADRLEYIFCDLVCHGFNISQLKRIYDDIIVMKNEYGIDEIGFQTEEIGREFADIAIDTDSQMFSSYESKIGMSFLADMLTRAFYEKCFTLEDLYKLTDNQVLDKIEQSGVKTLQDQLAYFIHMKYYRISKVRPETTEFTVDTVIKKRYIDPLVMGRSVQSSQEDGGVVESRQPVRLSSIDELFRKKIDHHLNRPLEWISINYKI